MCLTLYNITFCWQNSHLLPLMNLQFTNFTMSAKLKKVFEKIIDVEEKPLSFEFAEVCFSITITAAERLDGGSIVELIIEPEMPKGYDLIVDYKFVVDASEHFVERDIWRGRIKEKEKLLAVNIEKTTFDVKFLINIREILAPQDLSVSTNYRNLNILTSNRGFYVNSVKLKELGGRLFKDWYDRECLGETSIVALSLDSEELLLLLEACCAYSSPILHRRNLSEILKIAEREKITGLLRLAESFLMESETMHKIRKLEYAAEFRMARLADFVLRSFPTKIARLDSLFDYLAQNGELFDEVHPAVLEMVEIYPDYVVI